MVGPGVRLRADEAAPLLHALIARAADDLGVRVLAIKGPVVALQGLRAERTSADVDVLVHPRELQKLVDGLVALGWRQGVPSTGARILPEHSRGMLSDLWPLGIDVHHYFPGFLADAGTVFDSLWARSGPVRLAGVPVPTLDRVGQVAVVGLHLLRSAPEGDSETLKDLVTRARRLLTEEDVQDLVALAQETDATVTLRPMLMSLGVPEQDLGGPRDREALGLWNRQLHAVGYEHWFHLLRQTPARGWPRTIWHALMLTDEEILAANHVTRGEANLAQLRWTRIRRGVQGLPRTVRVMAQARRRGDIGQARPDRGAGGRAGGSVRESG